MFRSRKKHDELRSYLEWQRQTRFIRRHGGPIVALALFATCLWFVWRACHSREAAPERSSRVEENQAHDIDRYLQATKMPKW
ncbi:hypothetical protein [Prosthecobacter sp.]|uniref:hypothetical protein n=1 Tax=Prosthecobacter sp. TaxID=1965333 RepID=UPI003784127C